MAKRSSTGTRSGKTIGDNTTTAPAVGAIEQQVLAFAEQLGYVAGTLQKRAGSVDRAALRKQISGVRDNAMHVLEQLARGVRRKAPAVKGPAPKAGKGRSGGVVDAPGKKHRKPAPAGPAAAIARSQNAKLRAATPMAKTYSRRARG